METETDEHQCKIAVAWQRSCGGEFVPRSRAQNKKKKRNTRQIVVETGSKTIWMLCPESSENPNLNHVREHSFKKELHYPWPTLPHYANVRWFDPWRGDAHTQLIGWLVSCLLAGPDLWKRMPLKCSIAMVFICPLPSWCKFSVGWQGYVTMETIWKNTGGFVYDWLIGMLLVSRSGHVEDNAVKLFHHYGVHLSSSLLMQIFSWLAGLCYCGDDMEEYRRWDELDAVSSGLCPCFSFRSKQHCLPWHVCRLLPQRTVISARTVPATRRQ